MGFSSEVILIKAAVHEEKFNTLLAAIGFTDVHFSKKAYFEEADTRSKTGIYIGNYNNATILIYDGILDGDRGSDNMLDVERALITLLPGHEILSLMNVESVNAYLYHYIVDGKTRRLRYGAHGSRPIEEGEELSEEKKQYMRKELRGKEEIYFTKSSFDDGTFSEWSHDQLGGSIAFSLATMFVGTYYSAIPLELQLNQYLTAEQINGFRNIDAPSGRQTGKGYFNKRVIAADFFPLLERQIVPSLAQEGFLWDSDSMKFTRTVNEVEQSFSLGSATGGPLLELNLRYSVKSNALYSWIKEKYGMSTFGDDRPLDDRSLNLRVKEDQVLPQQKSKKINIDEFIALLEHYVKISLLPYFKTFSSLEAFAEHAYYRCFRADFYFMLGKKEEALEQLTEIVKSIRKENTREQYYKDIDVRLTYGFPGVTRADLQEKIQIAGQELTQWQTDAILKAWKDGWELMQDDRIFTPEMRTFDSSGKINITVMDKEEPQALEEHYKSIIPLPAFAILQHCGDVVINNKQERALVSRIKLGDQTDTVKILPVAQKFDFSDPFLIIEVHTLTLKEASQQVSYVFEPLFGNKRITVSGVNEDMVAILQKMRAAKGPHDWTAIQEEVTKANVNFRDGNGATFLHAAINNAPTSFIEYILKTGADPNIANYRYGRTPAYYPSDITKHKLLIDHSLNVNHLDDSGWTAAQYLLHAKGVLRIYLDSGLDLSLKSVQGRTILFEMMGRPDELRMIADKGADLNTQDNWGLTLLHLAILYYDAEAVALLKQRKARHDLRTTKSFGDPDNGLVIPENMTARELVFMMKEWRASYEPQSWKAEHVADTAERFDKIWIWIVEGRSPEEAVPVKGVTQLKPVAAAKQSLVIDEEKKKEIEKLRFRSVLGGALRTIGLIVMVIGFFASSTTVWIGATIIVIGWIIKIRAQGSLNGFKEEEAFK